MHKLFVRLVLIALAMSSARSLCADGHERAVNASGPPIRLPLVFEPNVGQAGAAYSYVAHEPGLGMGLNTRGIDVFVGDGKNGRATVRLEFDQASEAATLEAEQLLSSKSNYLRGSEVSGWRSDVPNYARIRYHNLYPGVELLFYENDGDLEHDFVLAAGSDLRQIAFHLEGARKVKLTAGGDLLITVGGGTLRMKRPRAYQDTPQGRMTRRVRYRLHGKRVRFEAESYDSSLPLVIDPVLTYSTFLAGSNDSRSIAVTVDASGAAYVTGLTFGADFPTVNAFQGICGSCPNKPDVFVTKFNSSGSGLVYSTFLGGIGYDSPFGIAVDNQGNAIVVGGTDSPNFPTVPREQPPSNRNHGFVTSLTPAGNGLNWSRYIKGSYDESASAVALDASDNVYVTGSTNSPDFPVTPGTIPHIDPGYPFNDIYVEKFSKEGILQFSTIFGRKQQGYPLTFTTRAIAIDRDGNPVVAGSVGANLLTTPGAFQTEPPNPEPHCGPCANGFVIKINSDASAVIFSTYFGGREGAPIAAMTLDENANVYFTGPFASPDLPVTPGAFQTSAAEHTSPSFVSVLDSSGSALVYSTFLGPTQRYDGEVYASSIAIDAEGNAYVGGSARTRSFPLLNPLRSLPGSSFGSANGGFITELNPAGSALLFSSYLNGSVGAEVASIALDGNLAVYVTGNAYSNDFPTTEGAYKRVVPVPPPFVSLVTPFLTKLDLQTPAGSVCLSQTPFGFPITRVGVRSRPQTIVVKNCGNSDLTLSDIATTGPFEKMTLCTGAVLMPGEDCPFSLTFTPPGVGMFEGTVSISSNAAISKITLPLFGAGAIPTLELPSSFISEPVVIGHSSARQLLFLRNSGQIEINIAGMSATGDFTVENQCPAILFPLQSCFGVVIFTPTAAGTRSGTVTVQDDAAGGPHVLSATGNGLPSYPVPSVSSSAPTMVAVGTGFQLRVSGANFFPESVIRVNGVDQATSYQQSRFLYTDVNASEVNEAGDLPVSVFNPGPGGGESNVVTITVFRALDLSATNLIYDPNSARLLATVGDSVIPIDPATGQTGTPIKVGAQARRMAVSNDGHYLYVGIDGENAIRRVDLLTETADLKLALGSECCLVARDIRVAPNDPNTVIVAVASFGYEAGINLYRDGTLVTRLKNDFSDGYVSVDVIAFLSNDDTKVYGFDQYNFSSFEIGASGLRRTSTLRTSYVMGIGLDSDQQYLYGTSGRVVNPANGAIVFTYPILGFSNSVIRDTDRTYFLDFSGKIVAFDQNQQRLGELALPQQGTNLVRWCEDGFAVLLNSIPGQVIIFRPPLARR
jgi:hypothetical protein